MNAIPAADCFEVFFVPAAGSSLRLCAPIRIGEPMADQADARDLAEVAATDLPAYGFPRGEVIIQQNAAVVQVLTTIRPSGHQASSASRDSVGSLHNAWSQQEVARLALEDLRQQVSRAKPTQTAPTTWIACLIHVQKVIDCADELPGDRPDRDGQPLVTMDTLHRRILAVQHQFDNLVVAKVPVSAAPDASASSTW